MATSGTRTPEYQAILKNYANLVESLGSSVDPALFAMKLCQKHLISQSKVDAASVVGVLTGAQRIGPLISAVHSQIKLKASIYRTFMSILEEENAIIADQIKKTYAELGGKPHQQQPSLPLTTGATQQQPSLPLTTGAAQGQQRTQPIQEQSPGATAIQGLVPQFKWFPEGDRQYIQADGGNPKHEYFPAYPQSKKFQPRVLSFGTVTPELITKPRHHSCYAMRNFPHGVAVIINNSKFKRQEERKGSDVDERNAGEAFRYLGYDVLIYRDLSASEIQQVFIRLSKADHSNYDSFICCILSHGTSEGIRGSDDALVNLRQIKEKMNGTNCPSLREKPKMFFIQACRGVDIDRGSVVPDGSSDSGMASDSCQLSSVVSDGEVVPNEAHFFFGYATPDGYKAWRDEHHGSWYITELCRSLCTKAVHSDLKHLIQEVRAIVATTYENKGQKMMPQDVTSLWYDVHFFPA